MRGWLRNVFISAVLLFSAAANEAASASGGDAASEYAIRFWRTEDGLPQNSVTAIAQSEDGYLWIGTRNGLVRFDGLRFVNYNRLTTPELPSNQVIAMSAGASDLWIALEGGIVRMHGAVFEAVKVAAQVGRIYRLLATRDGTLWIAGNNGLFVLRKGQQEVERIAALAQVPVRSLCADAKGGVWIGAANGLWRYVDGKVTATAPMGAPVTSLASGPDGVLWIGGDSFGLLQRAADVEAPRRVWSVSAMTEVLRAASGEIWVTKQGGRLEKLPPETGASMELSLEVESINCLFEDRENNLWVGTENGGLAQIRRRTLRLYPSKSIASVTEDARAQIWVADEAGQVNSLKEGRFESAHLAPSAPEPLVEAICANRSGGIWAGSRFDGLFHWSGSKSAKAEKRAATIGVTALFEDRQERLWVGSGRDGATMIDGGMPRVVRSPEGKAFEDVVGFAQGNDGRIWIATRRHGIAEWRGAGTQWLANQQALREGRIQCIYIDSEGDLWIGTSRGLSLSKDGQIVTATTQQGLYDDMIYQVLEDSRGNLWLGSNRGIFRVSKDELQQLFAGKLSAVLSTPYGIDRNVTGLEGVGGGQPTAVKAQDGKLWFATRRGLAMVDPNREAPLATLPVAIEELRVDQEPISTGGTNQIAKIAPGYHQLQIRFTALKFAAPERTQFRYQLEGVDRDWNQADATRAATYPQLPAGDYRFRVMARNDSPTWSEAPVLLLRVAPRYWETMWFKLLVAGAALAVFALFWADRISKQRQWDAMRQQITRDLHDDLGSNIGSIALLSEALQKPRSPNASAELLKEINQISRQTLDAMRDAVWFVDPEKDSSTDLVARLKVIADSMLKGMAVRFDVFEGAGARKMPLPLKRGIVLMFKETLHNVSRHAEATEVKITVRAESSSFGFEVVDNGKGFDPNAPRAGHGLKNLRQRAEKLGGALTIESAPGQGARVSFQIRMQS